MSFSGMSPQKRGFVFLGSVLTFSIVIYIAIAALITSGGRGTAQPGMQGFATFLFVAGFLCLAIALYIAPRESQAGNGAPAMTPAAVRGKGFLALIVSEMGAVFGLVSAFATMRLSAILVLGGGAIAVNLLWIVPQAVRLIETGERAEMGAGPATV
jgi:hypothetical protein